MTPFTEEARIARRINLRHIEQIVMKETCNCCNKSIRLWMFFFILSIVMRGSGCWRDEEDSDNYPQPGTVYHSIMSEDGYAVLSIGASVDVMEFFGGQGGTSKAAVRRKLKTGPIVDLVFGFDISKRERERAEGKVVT